MMPEGTVRERNPGRSGRPAEPVVGSGDGYDGAVRGRIVLGIQPIHHQRPVQGYLQAGTVAAGDIPVHAEGRTGDENGAATIFGPGGETPEAEPDEGLEGAVAEVALCRNRHGDLPEGDGSQREFGRPVVAAVFGHETQESGTPEADSEAHLPPVVGLRLQWGRRGPPGAEEPEDEAQRANEVRTGHHYGMTGRRDQRKVGAESGCLAPDGVDLRGNRTASKVTPSSSEDTACGPRWGRRPGILFQRPRARRISHIRPAALLGGIALMGVIAACEAPDRPPVLAPGLPVAAVDFLEPDRIRAFRLDPGVVYREVRSGPNPWVVHLLEVDLSRCDLGFQVEGSSEGEGRVPVTTLARRTGPGLVAAVNGDFFTPEDLPLGVEASGGAIRGRSTRPVFAWRPGNGPWIGSLEWDGDSIRVGNWAFPVEEPDARTEILGGYPTLLRAGGWVGDLQQADRPAFSTQRHPRTALGFDPGSARAWLVVVDGRGSSSEGMTLPELADLLRALGAREALNLDGGGSSVMVIRGETVTRPSDPQGERAVVNALVVRRDAAYCRPARR